MLPPFGVKGGACELALVTPDDTGLRLSAELLVGGVKRFPTLDNEGAGGCTGVMLG